MTRGKCKQCITELPKVVNDSVNSWDCTILYISDIWMKKKKTDVILVENAFTFALWIFILSQSKRCSDAENILLHTFLLNTHHLHTIKEWECIPTPLHILVIQSTEHAFWIAGLGLVSCFRISQLDVSRWGIVGHHSIDCKSRWSFWLLVRAVHYGT